MAALANFFANNSEWIFSGIGVFILGLIVKLVYDRRKNTGVSQTIRNRSHGIQAVSDINLGQPKPKVTSKEAAPPSDIQQTIKADSTGLQAGGNVNADLSALKPSGSTPDAEQKTDTRDR